MIQYQYDNKNIIKKRAYITQEFMKLSPNIKSKRIKEISPEDIKILFELYDKVFLNKHLENNFPGNFKFSLSKRMTRSAGLTLCPKNIGERKPEEVIIEIRIGVNFFFQYHLLERDKKVCEIQSHHALEALQLVLEHEICHVIEFIYFHQSSCKGNQFKTIARNLFGHTSSYHELPSNREIAKEKFNLHIGDKITFDFEEKILEGMIYAINKRATVMVPDKKGQYADKEGNKYNKYYVPVGKIKKCEIKG
ncbi:SprT-like domain-containing protein [Irregularibacter muris]|uniref:SprT-like domain-containing protein n=1 Tax=Irregularibacter muris TaxID=1796619 RepID=A0AAE3HF53_9FIRM|nr:SprT-like domain-containing protein [Irregularibacter muris]MCR1897428.1 SprT-like domain-containing protein [Irregularibacter muris]